MVVEFSIVPLGTGSSVSDKVARVLKTVIESGLPYKINPMGTVVEGEWDEVMDLINACRQEVLRESERVLIRIDIDDRPGRKGVIEGKVASVEKKLGTTLSK